MLKKTKTTVSGKLVLVKSVRRHWTSGGCPLSADRSGTETAQPQNEILCSKGLGGAALNKQAERKITKGFSLVCIPSSRQLKKYKIFVLPGWISGNIFMPPIVAFHEIPLVLRLQVLSVAGRLYSNLYIL